LAHENPPSPLSPVAVNTNWPAIRVIKGWRTARARRAADFGCGAGRAGDSRTSRRLKKGGCSHRR
jgi:hypothetical protein